MKIKLNSTKLADAVSKVKKANESLKKSAEALTSMDKKHKKDAFKVQRLKEKGAKTLHDVLLEQNPLNEFQYSGQMEFIDKETVEVEIHDAYEDNFGDAERIKANLREQRKDKQGLWQDPLMFTGHKEEKEDEVSS